MLYCDELLGLRGSYCMVDYEINNDGLDVDKVIDYRKRIEAIDVIGSQDRISLKQKVDKFNTHFFIYRSLILYQHSK